MKNEKKEFLDFVLQYISDNKRALFENVIENRTNYATVVLEDLYQPHNASAVMRTCDCFGIQTVHIIENTNQWSSSPDVERGSSKWLTLKRYNSEEENTAACLESLEVQGYQIVATTPHTEYTIDEIPIDKPLAFVFGTEQNGVSMEVLNRAHYKAKIPMYGFTESFNISVAAAICMHNLRERLKISNAHWQLPEDVKVDTMLHWCSKTLDRYEKYHKIFQDRREG